MQRFRVVYLGISQELLVFSRRTQESLGECVYQGFTSFARATLPENCLLLGTDIVRGQIPEHASALNGGYCLYIKVKCQEEPALRRFGKY